jgi:hypothetical protein
MHTFYLVINALKRANMYLQHVSNYISTISHLTSKVHFSVYEDGPLFPCSYGSWIYNYLCTQCLSLLMLWVRILIRVRCTHTFYLVINALKRANMYLQHVFAIYIYLLVDCFRFHFVITFLIGNCFDSDLRRDSVYLMTRSLSINKNRIGIFIKILPTDHQMECESGSNRQASRCK